MYEILQILALLISFILADIFFLPMSHFHIYNQFAIARKLIENLIIALFVEEGSEIKA